MDAYPSSFVLFYYVLFLVMTLMVVGLVIVLMVKTEVMIHSYRVGNIPLCTMQNKVRSTKETEGDREKENEKRKLKRINTDISTAQR